MQIKPPRHEIRYGAPWHHGERHRRYHVFEPPRWLQAWWDFIDPIIAMKEYALLYVATVVGMIVEVVATVGIWAFGIYIYGWHVLPVVIDTLF